MNEIEAVQFVKNNLGRHKQFVIATVGDDGNPWTVCVNLAYDTQFNFIWKSLKTAEHSRHISTNPNIALMVFSETEDIGDFGFYAKAKAHEVVDAQELERVIDIRFTQKGKTPPDIAEFTGGSSVRLYVAEISEAWVNDNQHLKTPVNLGVLRSD